MSSLGFDLLDRHVVDGRGDDIACTDVTGTLTYARLLERSAVLAGGLRAVGVRAGDDVAVEVASGNLQVVIVCACVRLGAIPGNGGEVRIAETAGLFLVHTSDDEFDLSVVQKAGATDPASSLASDPPGYVDDVRTSFGDVIDSLLAGSPVV
ncbi:MAG: AMP-binding protein [Aeromicrobium sp.]